MTRNVLKTVGFIRVAFVASVALPLIVATSANAQTAGAPPAGPGAGAPAAAGAGAAGGQAAEAERVIVTGSNIPTSEEVGPNPVFSINRDLINKSGQGTTVEQLLKTQPIANSNSGPVNNNATSQGGPAGTASLALRGFDPGATLVLVDGRRVAPFPGFANSGAGFTDLLTLPISAVQTIDVLKDGASTTYGADAVAGVVNLKFYKDYRGAQLSLYYGDTLDKDAGQYNGDILFGTGDDKTSIVGDIFFFHHNSMFNHDRGNSAKPPFLSSNTSPYNLQVTRASVLTALGLPSDPTDPANGNNRNLNPKTDPTLFTTDANGNPILNANGLALVGHDPTNFTNRNDATNLAGIPKFPGGSSIVRKLVGVDRQPDGSFLGFVPNNTFFGTAPTGTNGLAPASNYIYNNSRVRTVGGLLPGFNFNHFSQSYPEQERWGGYVAFNEKICDDQLQLFGDFYYADVKSHDELAPNATGSFQTPGSFVIFIPPKAAFTNDNPGTVGGPPPRTPTAAQVGAPAGAFNPFNPFQQFLSGGTRARIADFGNRVFLNENEAWLTTIGIKGDKLFDGSWGYEGAFRYSQILNISQAQDVNGPRFERILNGNDTLFNPASSDFIGQTTPYDPFNDFKVPIAKNIPLIKYATLHRRDLNTSKLATLDLNIYTTDLFDLPGGPVGLSIGASFSRDTYTINPDDQGNLIHPQELGVGGTHAEHAGRKEVAFYGETRIPIFGPEMGVTGFHSLEFDFGARFEDWRNNDTNALVPKVTMRWQPIDEQLTIRSTWGEGFLEPSMGQLYGPTFFALGPTVFNGVGSFAPQGIQSETQLELQPNKHLAPEHDRTWTGGFVWTPKWIPPQYGTFTFSVDFWDVERTGVIMPIAPQALVNQFIREGGTGKIAAVISPAKPSVTEAALLFDPGANFNGVSTPWQNGGRMTGRGVDLELNYQLQTGFGTFTSLTRASYLEDFMFGFKGDFRGWHVAGQSNNDVIEGAFFGQVTGGDGWMRWKGTELIDWTWKNWTLDWTVHYLAGFREEPARTGLNHQPVDGHERLHYVNATWFNDASLSYSFIFAPPVESQPVAGYSKGGKEVIKSKEGKEIESTASYSMPCWKTVLNNTTLTVGVLDIFGEDPPTELGFEQGNSTKYPGFNYDNLGRFVYGKLTKKF